MSLFVTVVNRHILYATFFLKIMYIYSMHINIVYFSHPCSSLSFCKCMYTIYYITKICKSKKLLHVSIRCNNLEWELLAPLIFFSIDYDYYCAPGSAHNVSI